MKKNRRANAVHAAMQKALNLIEDRVAGRPLNLDDVADMDELARVNMSLVVIGGSMAESFDRPTSDVVEALRLMAIRAVD
jgi:predicted short-subunit dehydrogenase-like oxidoreductase (DUF2520 family)